MAQPFDVRQLTLTGEAVPVAEQIGRFASSGVGTFSASDTVLTYFAAPSGGSSLAWLDRNGTSVEVVGDRAEYADLKLSRDGTQVSVSVAGASAFA